jgi:hypothetical protein
MLDERWICRQELGSMRRLSESLIQAMLFVNAPPLTDMVASTSGFDAWFQAQGQGGAVVAGAGSQTTLFKYPLSYLVYFPALDALLVS